MISIEAIKQKIIELGALIDAPKRKLILLEKPSDDGRYHLEIRNDEYHYISTERGQENDHIVTKDVELVLYKFFKNVASDMASDYEIENRIENIDSRRIKFAKQIEIMEKLNSDWGESMECEIEKILEVAPYDDLAVERVKLYKALKDAGMSAEQADEKVYEKFPLPNK